MLRLAPARRRQVRIFYLPIWGLLFLLYGSLSLIGIGLDQSNTVHDSDVYAVEPGVWGGNDHYQSGGRQLLSVMPNCSPAAIEQFPRTLFTLEQSRQGAVVLYTLCAIYMFVGLALTCDDYFVPSLERICEATHLQPDVAGATFMAAGSSAPELATAVIGVFISKDDIGLSAVVGSAVYNILFVVSVSALFSGAVIYLHWWPLFRDSGFYLISIIALLVVIIDERIHWYEAVSFLVLYALYIVLMVFNPRLESWFVKHMRCCPQYQKADKEVEEDQEEELEQQSEKGPPSKSVQMSDLKPETETEESGLDSDEDRQTLLPSSGRVGSLRGGKHQKQNGVHAQAAVKKDGDEDKDERFTPPKSLCRRVLWVLSLPLIVLLFLTVPDTRRPRWRRWFMLTFLMSCIWISAFCYVMVWMITVIGHTFSIPDTVMSLTFIAAGVSVPDAIASVIVAREGEGDMAISNAIGSNVVDILACLGLPWFMKTCVINPNSVITVYSGGLIYGTMTLFITVIFLIGATWFNGWRLTRKYGAVLMVAYVLVTILTTLYELNVFGYVHPPECPTDF